MQISSVSEALLLADERVVPERSLVWGDFGHTFCWDDATVQGQSSNCEFGSEPLSIFVFEQPQRPNRAGQAIQLLEALQVSRVVDPRRNSRKVSCVEIDDMAPPQVLLSDGFVFQVHICADNSLETLSISVTMYAKMRRRTIPVSMFKIAMVIGQ